MLNICNIRAFLQEYIVYSEFVRRIKKYMRKSQSKARYKCLSNEFDIKPWLGYYDIPFILPNFCFVMFYSLWKCV